MQPIQQCEPAAEYTHHTAATAVIVPSMRDGDLINLARSGNQAAFETLVERYYVPLHHYIAPFFSDYDQRCEVFQQVLIKLYLSLSDLRTDVPVQAWLFRVARNRCVDELRRKYVPHFSELLTEESEEEGLLAKGASLLSPSVEELVERREVQQFIYQAISNLPQRYRAIVWLRYSTLLTFGEIGRILHIPEATAKTYFQRSKLQLRQTLGRLLS